MVEIEFVVFSYVVCSYFRELTLDVKAYINFMIKISLAQIEFESRKE